MSADSGAGGSATGMTAEEAKSSMVKIAILIDELRNENMEVRLNSIRKLGLISATLGPVRTRDELIPYLNGMFFVLFLVSVCLCICLPCVSNMDCLVMY
jgi:hypothetical protein